MFYHLKSKLNDYYSTAIVMNMQRHFTYNQKFKPKMDGFTL